MQADAQPERMTFEQAVGYACASGKAAFAAAIVAPDMPDYLDAKARTAAPEVTFPIRSIGRVPPRNRHKS